MSEREEPDRKRSSLDPKIAEADEATAAGSAPDRDEIQYRASGGSEGAAPFNRVLSARAQVGANVMQRLAIMRKVGGAADIGSQAARPQASVSEPGEPAEQEADQVADEVASDLHGGNEDKTAKAEKPSAPKTPARIAAKLDGVGLKVWCSKDAKDKKEHRGRLQVQGKDLEPELSWPWASEQPPTADGALAALEGMKSKLSKNQLAIRSEAFEQAAKFIIQAKKTGGVDAPVSQSYQNKNLRPNEKTARVDIEVRTGKAFV